MRAPLTWPDSQAVRVVGRIGTLREIVKAREVGGTAQGPENRVEDVAERISLQLGGPTAHFGHGSVPLRRTGDEAEEGGCAGFDLLDRRIQKTERRRPRERRTDAVRITSRDV
jgi:hypothetical protein